MRQFLTSSSLFSTDRLFNLFAFFNKSLFLRLFLFVVLVPVLLFFAIDRAIISYTPFWQSIADEIPLQRFDPYRVEGILRSTLPGRKNVFILGDSTTIASVDPDILDQAFSASSLKFQILSIGGSASVTFGLMANSLADLDPSAVIIFASPYTLRSRNFYKQIHSYDIRVVPDLFNKNEIYSHLPFHLTGLAGQSNVLIRHRHAMQRVGLIQLGFNSWGAIAREDIKRKLANLKKWPGNPLLTWVKDREPENFPNPNSRAIALLAKHFGQRDAKFIAIESSIHPLFGMLLQKKKLSAFREQIEKAVQNHGMSFISAAEIPTMTVADFKDHSHLNAQGKSKFTHALIPLLRKTLKLADPIKR